MGFFKDFKEDLSQTVDELAAEGGAEPKRSRDTQRRTRRAPVKEEPVIMPADPMAGDMAFEESEDYGAEQLSFMDLGMSAEMNEQIPADIPMEMPVDDTAVCRDRSALPGSLKRSPPGP